MDDGPRVAERVELSIVVPAHNEATRLPGALVSLKNFAQRSRRSVEVLVVENGSDDGTLELARLHQRGFPELRVLHDPVAGKGRAVRKGMLAARGAWRLMCDVDLSMPPSEIPKFLDGRWGKVDIVVGSRELQDSEVRCPMRRRLMRRGFGMLVRGCLDLPVRDSQCGFKCFRGAVADRLFRLQRLDGFSFDVEVLWLARQLGMRVVEIPIRWVHDEDSRVHPIRDSLRMAKDIVVLRRKWHKRLRPRGEPCATS